MMAYSTKPTFFLITILSLVLLSTTTPKANAAEVTVRGETLNPQKVVINGTAKCTDTVTGPCLNGPPIANVTVWATLNGKRIASTTTNSNGSFNIDITNKVTNIVTSVGNIVDGLIVHIPLPIQKCPIYANAKPGQLVGNTLLPPLNEIRNRVATGRCINIQANIVGLNTNISI